MTSTSEPSSEIARRPTLRPLPAEMPGASVASHLKQHAPSAA